MSPTQPSTARSAVAEAFGEPHEVVKVRDTRVPVPGAGQVLVRMNAAGVNPYDAKRVRGMFGTDSADLPLAIGGEASGVVEAVGDGADVAPGDPVVVYPATGAFAEFILAPAANVHPKPDDLPYDEAASLLLAGVTAADILATLGLTKDDVLLVHGGAGAVGSIVVARAVQTGAKVIATAAEKNHKYVRSLGAVPVTYGDGLEDRVREASESAPVTAVADTVGSDEAIDVSLALVPADRIVSIAAWDRMDDGITVVGGSTEESKRNRREAIPGLLQDAADGKIVVEIAGEFPLALTGSALEAISGKHPRGKYVVRP